MTHSDGSGNPARAFYDRISGVYDAISDANERSARETGLAMLSVAAGEAVLEVGYGTGHTLLKLAEAVGESGKVCGVDISEGMRRISEKSLADAGLDTRVELNVSEVPPLKYGDNEFDAVTMSFTLELFSLEVIPEVLSEVRRILKPGGRLGVVSMATTAVGESDSLLERTYKWMHQHFPHIVDCQPIDVAGLLAGSGATVEKCEEMQIWTMPVRAVVARFD